MVPLTELINTPITIEGKEVILVQDTVAETLERQGEGYSLITEATGKCPDIYVFEQNLKEARVRFPDYPVYGLWQVLICSDVLKPNLELQVIPTDKRDGIFVRFELDTGNVLLTGEYADGIFQRAGDLFLEQAIPIEFNLRELRLPTQPARLLEEWVVIHERAKRRVRLTAGAIAAGILVLGTLVDQAFRVHFDSNIEKYDQKKSQLTLLEQKVRELERSKILSFPNYSKLLTQLNQILALSPRTSIPPQNLTAPQFVAVAPKELIFDLHSILAWTHTLQLPNSDWKVVWKNPGVDHETPRH